MEEEKLVFKAKVVADREFLLSCWAPEDYMKLVEEALSEFERQFDVKFELANPVYDDRRLGKFVSPSEMLKPLFELSAFTPREKVVDVFLSKFEEVMGRRIPAELSLKLKPVFDDIKNLESKDEQYLALLDELPRLTWRVIYEHCKEIEIGNNEILICLTGKMTYFGMEMWKNVAGPPKEENEIGHCMVIGIFPGFYASGILHELAHLFGAEDVENRFSVMNIINVPFVEFDEDNKKIIRARLNLIRATRKGGE